MMTITEVVATQHRTISRLVVLDISFFLQLIVKSLMAEKTSVYLTNGGLWNTHKPQYSAETAKVLKSKIFFSSFVEELSGVLFSLDEWVSYK